MTKDTYIQMLKSKLRHLPKDELEDINGKFKLQRKK